MKQHESSELRKGILSTPRDHVLEAKEELDFVNLLMYQGRENVSDMVKHLEEAKTKIDKALSALPQKEVKHVR